MPNNNNPQFDAHDVASDVMKDASSGEGLRNEFSEMRDNLNTDQFNQVFKEMQNLSGTEGYEDVLVTNDSILFNPNGESFKKGDGSQNMTKWKYSSETENLLKTDDRTNVLDGKLDGVKEQNDKADEKPETAEVKEEPAKELSTEEMILGEYDTPQRLQERAREKGRPDLIDTSKEVAEKILKGEDVYEHFEGENAHNQRLLWKLSQSAMLDNITPETNINVAKSGENTYITLTGMDNGANILMQQSNLGIPRDITVMDNVGAFGTGIGGSSVMATAQDAFVTPQDEAAQANQPTWADNLRESFYDSLKGENWDSDIEKMREMKRVLTEEPDSEMARQIRERLKDNPKVIWVGKDSQ